MSTGTNKERLEQNNVLLENIKTQVQNLPEAGGIDTSDATATANDIAKNKTAYVNGEKVTGNVYDLNSGNWMVHTIRLYGQDMLSFTNGTSSVLVRENGSFVANFNEIAPVIGLTADKIVSGNTILGVEGTAETGNKLPDNMFIQSDVPTKTTDEAIWLKEELLWSPDAYIGGGKYIKNFVEQLTDEQKILFNKYPYKMGMDRNGQLFAVVASENPAVITTYDSNYINFDGSATNNNISISYRSSNSTWSVSESTTINVNVNKRNGGSMSYSNYDIYDADGVKRVNSKSSVPIVEEGLHIENGEKRYTVYYSNGADFEKILDTSNADATAEDIAEGKTAFVNNTKITGSIPNNGELNITPGKEPQTIPTGYTSGGTVSGDTNLLPENIKSGTTIFGVNGTLEAVTDVSEWWAQDEEDATRIKNISTGVTDNVGQYIHFTDPETGAMDDVNITSIYLKYKESSNILYFSFEEEHMESLDTFTQNTLYVGFYDYNNELVITCEYNMEFNLPGGSHGFNKSFPPKLAKSIKTIRFSNEDMSITI